MADRVILDEDGLLVSIPGINADVATKNQLLFNSDWRNLQYLEGGQVTLPDPLVANGTYFYGRNPTTGAANTKSGYKQDVSFSTTYVEKPILICNAKRKGQSIAECPPIVHSIMGSHGWPNNSQPTNPGFALILTQDLSVSGYGIYCFGMTDAAGTTADRQWWAGAVISWTAWRFKA